VTDKIPVNVQAAPTTNQAPAEAEEDSDDGQEEGTPEAGATGGMKSEIDTFPFYFAFRVFATPQK
jgi:hypothetical protein